MKAIRFMDPGVIEYSEIPQPEIRDDEVLAQIAYAGFCATDIELLTGEMIHIKNGNTKYPIIPGHEWSGTVVAVGKNVRDFKVGDRVTSDVSLGCGECENCRQGHYNLCPNREVVGSYRNRQGVFAQYVAIPQRHLYHIPEGLSLEEAALAEPAATAMYAVTKAQIPAGAQVLVQLDGSKELLEGFLPADGEHFDDFLDDSIQAISYQGAGADNAQLDVVLFANTLTNKTNQRDEYNFISNAAWAAVLNDTGYSDVAPNAWYAEAVAAVTGQGLMNGVTSKAFGPNVTTTRGMLVTVLHRMAGEPAASASAGFADVAAGSYCAAAVDWAYEAGITSGASSTGFAPDSALTREQAVTLLCNYAEAQGLDVSAAADLSGYPDASAVSAFAQDAVAWAVDAGLLTGTGAGTLNPQGTATRAELAALLVRAEALFTAE